LEILINPIGEFPLNDDWAYARAVYSYVNESKISFSDWQAIPLFPQLITGVVVCKLFGFSFTALRFISIISTIILIFIFQQLLKTLDIKPIYGFLLLLLLSVNPLSFSLSNTFMPDIFTLMLNSIAFLFMIKIFTLSNNETSSKKFYLWFLFFILFSLLTTLNRPTGIIQPIAFGIIFFFFQKIKPRNLFIGFLPSFLCILSLILSEFIFERWGKLPANYNYQFKNILKVVTHPNLGLLKTFTYYFITSTVCLGLLISPLTISNLKIHFQQIQKHIWIKLVFSAYLILIIIKVFISGNIFPFVGNMFYPFGTGPVILTQFLTHEMRPPSFIWICIFIVLNFIGAISFFSAFTSIFSKMNFGNPDIINRSSLFFLLFFTLYFIPICLSYANDRYLLFILPCFIFTYLFINQHTLKMHLFPLVFIPILLFSIMSTHDYFSINKARWRAINYLTENLKVLPTKIDGGFEFNCWHFFGSKNYDPSHKGRWWCIQDDAFIISPSQNIPGYKTEKEFKFSSWGAFDFNKIYIFKKESVHK
jgi:hypothetical protein